MRQPQSAATVCRAGETSVAQIASDATDVILDAERYTCADITEQGGTWRQARSRHIHRLGCFCARHKPEVSAFADWYLVQLEHYLNAKPNPIQYHKFLERPVRG